MKTVVEGLLLVFTALLIIAAYETAQPPLAGLATHSQYPSFSSPEPSFAIESQTLTIIDAAVYKNAYYSIDGGDWVPFSLEGNPYTGSDAWLAGTSICTLPEAITEPGEHYIITYSCSYDDSWDCHGNEEHPQGFWQLLIITIPNETMGTGNESACFDSDGLDVFAAGSVLVDGEQNISDNCHDEDTVKETYCLHDDLQEAHFDCSNDCSDNRCNPEPRCDLTHYYERMDYLELFDEEVLSLYEGFGHFSFLLEGTAIIEGISEATYNFTISDQEHGIEAATLSVTKILQGVNSTQTKLVRPHELRQFLDLDILIEDIFISTIGDYDVSAQIRFREHNDDDDWFRVDWCEGDSLQSFGCTVTGVTSTSENPCPYGCAEGECSPQFPCFDSDGLDVFAAGSILVDGKYNFSDACYDADTVSEKFCLDEPVGYTLFSDCSNGCSEGQCSTEPYCDISEYYSLEEYFDENGIQTNYATLWPSSLLLENGSAVTITMEGEDYRLIVEDGLLSAHGAATLSVERLTAGPDVETKMILPQKLQRFLDLDILIEDIFISTIGENKTSVQLRIRPHNSTSPWFNVGWCEGSELHTYACDDEGMISPTSFACPYGCAGSACADAPPQSLGTIIADHTVIDDFDSIPRCWIEEAKQQVVMGYGHTSHGYQVTEGMTSLNNYVNSLGGEQNVYAWNNGGVGGALDLEEGSGYDPGWLRYDIGYGGWDSRTTDYLDSELHADVNSIMWSWCGQVGSYVSSMDYYLFQPALSIEDDYGVDFVFMTGHLDGTGSTGSTHLANEIIRNHVRDNGGVLFDFADIGRYDPDGNDYLNLHAGIRDLDDCEYDDAQGNPRNWCDEWCAAHPGHELCASISCTHSRSLNCNTKGRAFWWMVARMAGWNGLPEGYGANACP